MKLATKAVVLVGALALPAVAQIRGIPSSATSVTSFRGFNRNIPASVTSLGPLGFSSGRRFRHGLRFSDRLNRKRFGFFPVGIPIYVVADEPEVREIIREVPAEPGPSEPQKIEITIVDQREGRRPTDERPAAPAAPETPAAKLQPEPEAPSLPTIVVLQNGTRKELSNYAIMGKDLFDLADGRMFRIPLDSVDVEATVAANAANGKQFRLP